MPRRHGARTGRARDHAKTAATEGKLRRSMRKPRTGFKPVRGFSVTAQESNPLDARFNSYIAQDVTVSQEVSDLLTTCR